MPNGAWIAELMSGAVRMAYDNISDARASVGRCLRFLQ
jgi:hypothetical protein